MKTILPRAAATMVAALLLLLGVAGISQAGHDQSLVTNLSGCLTPGGDFKNVAAGNTPSKPCGQNDTPIHLSSGDITTVQAGNGLTGGATAGDATLALADGYALPQGCSAGDIVERGPSAWGCGTDNDTTYSAGTGLALSNTNQFSLASGYRVPQACGFGQVIKSTGPGTWTCGTDNNTTYDGTDFALSNRFCLPGQVVTGINSVGQPVCATDQDTTYSGANFAKSNASCPSGKYVSGISAAGDLVCTDLPAAATPTLDVVSVTAQDSIGVGGFGDAAASCPAGYKLVGGGWAAHNAPVSYSGYYQFDGANTYTTETGFSAIGGSVSSRAFCAKIS